jgi:uncharacterized peroxidase-related enzyme
MARLKPLTPEQISASGDESVSGLLDIVGSIMGFVPNSFLTMAHRPEMLKTFAAMAGTINAPGEVSLELKRMVAEVSSNAAGCQYCVAHTSHQAHRSGIAKDKLDDIWTFERSDLFSAAEKATLMVAMKAAQVPGGVEDADMAELKKYFDDGQIVEIVGVISLFGFLNRWNATLATALEDELRSFASETLPEGVWQIGNHASSDD